MSKTNAHQPSQRLIHACPARREQVTSEQSDTDADADEDDGLDRADSSGSDEAADVFYDAIELELQRSLSLTRSLSSGREVGNALASLSLGDEKEKAQQQQQQAAVQVQALPAQHADGARCDFHAAYGCARHNTVRPASCRQEFSCSVPARVGSLRTPLIGMEEVTGGGCMRAGLHRRIVAGLQHPQQRITQTGSQDQQQHLRPQSFPSRSG